MIEPPNKRQIAVFLLAALALLVVPVLDGGEMLSSIFLNTGYYFIMATVGLWCWALWRYLEKSGFSVRAFLRGNAGGLVFCALLTAALFVSVKPGYRVLSDEANLVGVSRSMFYDHRVDQADMGYWYFDGFYPLARLLEKRPLLFPFLTNLVHLVAGYSWKNAFVVNGLLAFATLFLLFRAARTRFGFADSCAGALMAASFPAFSLCATSAGFDLCASFLLLLFLLCARLYIFSPGSEELALLWCTGLLLANARYESFLFAVIGLGALAAFGYIKREQLGKSWLYILSAFLIPHLVWQRMLSVGHYEQPQGTMLFNISAFADNLWDMTLTQFNNTAHSPYNNLLAVAGLAMLVFIGVALLRGNIGLRDARERHFALIAGAFTVLALLIPLSLSFHNSYSHPVAYRLFLSFCLACAAAPLLFGALVRPWPRFALPAAALGMFILYHPVAVENRLANRLVALRIAERVYGVLDRLPPHNVLVISGTPGWYTVRNIGAMDFGILDANAAEIANDIRRRSFDYVLLVQRVFYKDGRVMEGGLPKELRSEVIYESECTREYFLRLSRVFAADLPGADGKK